jgi:coenzyme F420-reducing hydrogenase delta subunit
MGVIDSNCTGCGICISVCPANAIEIKKPESTAVSTEEERSTRGHLGEGPYSLAFCCENSAAIAAKSLADEELSNVSLVSVPCGGYLDAAQIIQALNKFERVIIAVCPDDACKHYDGNKRAKLQVEKVKKLLETFSIDPNRVDFVQLSHVMPYPLRDALSK